MNKENLEFVNKALDRQMHYVKIRYYCSKQKGLVATNLELNTSEFKKIILLH